VLRKEELFFNEINYKNEVIADNKDLRRPLWPDPSKN
jgi:hypothetical protein